MDYYVFELLIYREKEKTFYEKYNKALEAMIAKYIPRFASSDQRENIQASLVEKFWRIYGGPWNYNQVVGAIKIFICGDQIRGDLWLSNKKKFTKVMCNKNISLFGKAFEMNVFNDMSNDEIQQELLKSIIDSIKPNKRLVIDTECFINCSKYIDWKKLINRK
jgi:hypothetical protein